MGLDYLNKKTWHTASIKNIAKVWEREQKELRKHQRQDEYNKKLMEEQHAHELKIAQVEAGLIPRSALDKMDWMYNPVLGQQQQQQNTEQYLLGKPVDMQNLPNQAGQQANQDPQDNSNKYQAIVTEDVTNKTCENFTLTHEDPLFKIMQEELKMREKILSNPLDMVHLLQDEMILKQKVKADAKKKKKEKKMQKEKERQEKKDRKKEKKQKKKNEKSEKKERKREDSEDKEKSKKNKDKEHGEERRKHHHHHKYEDEEEENGRHSKRDQKNYRNSRSRSDSRKKSSRNDDKSRRQSSKDDKKHMNKHAKRSVSRERKTQKRKNSLSSDSLSSKSSSRSPSSSRSRSRSSQYNQQNDKLRQKKPNHSRSHSRSSSSSSTKAQKAVRDSLYDEFLQKRVGSILVRDEDGHLRPDFGLMKRKYRNNLRPEEKLKMTEEEKKEMLSQMQQNAKQVAEERVKEFDDDYKDEAGQNEDEKKLKDLHSKQQNPKFLASLQADIYGGSKDINALSSQIAKNKHKLARNVDSKNTFSKEY